MPCYHPMQGWYSQYRGPSGKRAITFKFSEGFKDRPVPIPCGTCVGCKLEKARQWAVRCMHEASLYESNCFVTLTYDQEHLDVGGSLVPEHWVLFMKRLRFKYGPGIRFFQCGEYGSHLARPHHHALLFNHDFPDKVVLRNAGERNQLWTSQELAGLWPFGLHSIGSVTFQSAGYIARYTLKKVVDKSAAEWYKGRVPEYLTMSRMPGIGRGWISKYMRDVYPSDELVVNGKVSKPPRYYDNVVEQYLPHMLKKVKGKRRALGKSSPDNTGPRLLVREVVKAASISTMNREVEL